MLDDANDQIVYLKSKLHGLRTIINQLRIVEKKYNCLKSKKNRRDSVSSKVSIDEKIPQKSSSKKSLKKSRNSYIKTSRTKDSNIYEEYLGSAKSINQSQNYRKKFKQKHSKLKINIKEPKSGSKLTPQSTQNYTHDYDCRPFTLLQSEKNLHGQRQILLDKVNRIESIISTGKSFDKRHNYDENFDPSMTKSSYMKSNNKFGTDFNLQNDFSPLQTRYAVSPVPTNRGYGQW